MYETVMLKSFFEPCTAKDRKIKWTVSILILVVGVGILLLNLGTIITYERVSKEPAYVDATISVVNESFSFDRYTSYLSYSYAGNFYENVLLSTNGNRLMINDDGKTITVAVNPEEPTQLVSEIVNNEFAIVIALVVISIGIAMVEYGIAVVIDVFHNWRIKKANRKNKLSFEPDYFGDVAVISFVNLIVLYVVMSFVFPATFGITSFIESL